eukprot:7133286-Pyramimonas_sp.AAC.1
MRMNRCLTSLGRARIEWSGHANSTAMSLSSEVEEIEEVEEEDEMSTAPGERLTTMTHTIVATKLGCPRPYDELASEWEETMLAIRA